MEELLNVLKEIAERFKSEIISKVRHQLEHSSLENLELFDYVFENYYRGITSGRWYDPYHVAYSTLFAVGLVKAKEASPLVVPAIILHDIGYYSTLVDKENWASKNSRIIHMQEGSGLAAEILSIISGFTASEIGKIVGMVASHDNGYLGISTADSDRSALRDADRAWVMHPLSFYKDWISKIGKGEGLSPLDLFRSRLTSFYGPEEFYPQEWGKAKTPDKEDAAQSPPFTKWAKKWRDLQFAARFYEIRSNIIENPDKFLRAIEDNIKSELTAGRG